MNELKPLRDYMHNLHSQCGEDGVLNEVIRRLELTDLWCCEFGAWDGRYASNTFNLVEQLGARTVMIEGDSKKYQDLLATVQQYPTIVPINAYVSYDTESPNHLDQLLSNTELPEYFDVLSIDIDGDDLVTWESINKYRSRIVIIEINARIEPGVFQRHSDTNYLNSFSSTVEVAQAKGYELICHTSCNLLFADQAVMPALNIEQVYIDNPELLFDWKWVKKGRKEQRKKAREQKIQEHPQPLAGD
jgi:hypothetical protein